MDVVLGLALTSTAVRWVLVEGATGEGAPIDRGQFQVDGLDADFLLDLLLNQDVVAESQLHAVGVTWTNEAAVAAGAVLDALAERGLRNVVAVSDNDAAAALASGVADITGHDAVAVCVIEPDSALVALVTTDAVTVDRIERPLDRADALELTSSVITLLDVDDRRPEAIFVVGSDDVDVIVSSFEAISETPVFSASEADLALARGAALASARDVNVNVTKADGALPGPSLVSRTRVLSVVLGAAVLTFVVSLSLALYVNLPQGSATEQPLNSNAAEEAAAPPPRPAAPARARPAVPEVAKTIMVRAPAPAAPRDERPAAAPVAAPPPVYQPPAPAYVPPAPAYVPPAPAYVPPPAAPPPVYQQPRLRDRIIERIPIINRFHEPQYPG
jgi:hypothetical protein